MPSAESKICWNEETGLRFIISAHRVTIGRNRDDGRSYFAGFLLRQQRIGTRGHLTCSRRVSFLEGKDGRYLDCDWSDFACRNSAACAAFFHESPTVTILLILES